MRIIFFGRAIRSYVCLKSLIDNKKNVVAVYPDSNDKELISFCKDNRIAIISNLNVNSKESYNLIKSHRPDLMIFCNLTQIVNNKILELASIATINLHGAKLPEYRGSSVINWQIINGEKEGGVSILHVDSGIDTGELIAEERFEIKDNDQVLDVIRKTLEIFPRLLVQVVEDFQNGTVTSKKLGKGTVYPHRNPEDGLIECAKINEEQAYNFVRALNHPLPGAFIICSGKKLIIWDASRIKQNQYISKKPGTLSETKNCIVLNLRGSFIKINKVQLGDSDSTKDLDFLKELDIFES